MATAVLPAPNFTSGAVAPWWHTTLFIAFFLLMAAGGAVLHHGAGDHNNLVAQRPNVALLYISLIAAEWGLIRFVGAALSRSGITLLQFAGARWESLQALLIDTLLAFALWLLWKGVLFCWALWLGTGHAASISPLIPRGALESVLWVALSVSAGIAEELAFRGYLQRQLTAFTGRAPLALVLQSVVFGIAHGYQGLQSCLAITLYGAVFTSLALWRKSLRPGMIAHAWTDIAAGLLR